VFNYDGSNRQARGIVSAGYPDTDTTLVDWTEAPVILAGFGLRLAPSTP